nr:hypothetical protein CFP56_29939 [Quercus suber]
MILPSWTLSSSPFPDASQTAPSQTRALPLAPILHPCRQTRRAVARRDLHRSTRCAAAAACCGPIPQRGPAVMFRRGGDADA